MDEEHKPEAYPELFIHHRRLKEKWKEFLSLIFRFFSFINRESQWRQSCPKGLNDALSWLSLQWRKERESASAHKRERDGPSCFLSYGRWKSDRCSEIFDQTVRFSLLITSAIEKKENDEDGPLIPCQQLWAWGSNRQLFDRQGIDRRWRHEILFQLWALEELR